MISIFEQFQLNSKTAPFRQNWHHEILVRTETQLEKIAGILKNN